MRLSHLAYIALGVVARDQPCSAYNVMQAFKGSTSSYYSGSAGAIYPLVQRLHKSGYLKKGRPVTGARGKDVYSISAKGNRVLKDWILTPHLEQDVLFSVDLLRVRMQFLGCLDTDDKSKFFDEILRALDEGIDQRKRFMEDHDLGELETLSIQGLIVADEARSAFFRRVRKQLGV